MFSGIKRIPRLEPGSAEFRSRITLAAAAVNLSASRRLLLLPPQFFRMLRRELALNSLRNRRLMKSSIQFPLAPNTFPVTLTSQRSAKTWISLKERWYQQKYSRSGIFSTVIPLRFAWTHLVSVQFWLRRLRYLNTDNCPGEIQRAAEFVWLRRRRKICGVPPRQL